MLLLNVVPLFSSVPKLHYFSFVPVYNKSLCLLPLFYNEISFCCSSSLFFLQVTENQKQIVITDGGEELSFDGSGGEQHIVYGDAEQVC